MKRVHRVLVMAMLELQRQVEEEVVYLHEKHG